MKNFTHILTAVLVTPALALASDLNLSVESNGMNAITVLPGEVINWNVVGELSDAANEGLAMFVVDVSYDGGPLSQAVNPASNPMLNFNLSNPAGYGGLVDSCNLLQAGGAQNTIDQGFAAAPTGSVLTGVAQPGAAEVLLSGSFDAPLSAGAYSLTVHNGVANVIRQGETGVDFWRCDEAPMGTVTNLTITVACDPETYCVGKQNSAGCTPAIGWSGMPSLSGPDDFHVTATDVINSEFGIFFWGQAPNSFPFFGGTLCVTQPIVRTANQASGGAGAPSTNCNGTFDFHFSQMYMGTHSVSAGTILYGQYWYRDPNHVDGTGIGLSNAITFPICL